MRKTQGTLAAALLTRSGAAEVAARIRELWQAGIDTVILRPAGDRPAEQFARAVAALSAK